MAGWLLSIWFVVLEWVIGPDRSANPEAVESFNRWAEEEQTQHWTSVPERKNRWHVQSCVVAEGLQGQGIGKALMREVLARAQAENVYAGVEATGPGERLYQSVGFKLLARFVHSFDGDRGGVMLWTPPGMKQT